MLTISVANQKGGVGKSTLTALLGISFKENFKIGIMDTDPQLSLYNNLKNYDLDIKLYKSDLVTFVSDIKYYKNESIDIMLVDTLPTTDTNIFKLFNISDLTLVPTGASLLDITATMNTIELLASLQVNYKVIFNNIKNINDLKEIKDYFIKNNIPIVEQYLFSRVAYSRLFKNYCLIDDIKAKEELTNLIKALN